MQLTLIRQKAELANAAVQREILEGELTPRRQPYFDKKLRDSGLAPLRATGIDALRRLNSLGYGLPGSGRKLSLVYNPIGISLPPQQDELEATYRRAEY